MSMEWTQHHSRGCCSSLTALLPFISRPTCSTQSYYSASQSIFLSSPSKCSFLRDSMPSSYYYRVALSYVLSVPTFIISDAVTFQSLSSYSSLYSQTDMSYFFLFSLASFSAACFDNCSTSFSETMALASSFSLNNCTNRGVARLLARLFLAKVLRREAELKTPPIPLSLEYMKEMRPVIIVLMFQEELQVSLWQWVKVVQMGLPTQKRPFSVRNLILGGEKGQSWGSQSTPWQKPLAKSSWSPNRQKWKLRGPSRETSACS